MNYEDRSLFEPTLDPKYLVLGYLQEYMGRDTGPDGDAVAGITMVTPTADERVQTVERFFPNEVHLVPGFRAALTAWGNREGLNLSLEVEHKPEGHAIVQGTEANRLINSCYAAADRPGPRGGAQVHEGMFPEISGRPPLKAETANPRFSYLLGSHLRNGNGAEFKFANAVHQAELVERFLAQLGCERLERERLLGGIPFVTKVRFDPTKSLATWLGLED